MPNSQFCLFERHIFDELFVPNLYIEDAEVQVRNLQIENVEAPGGMKQYLLKKGRPALALQVYLARKKTPTIGIVLL